MDVTEQTLVRYKRLPEWTAESLPRAFREQHNTKEGTWAKLTILDGQLRYIELDEAGSVLAQRVFSPDEPPPMVAPQAWHRVEPYSDDLRCYLEFYCEPDRYYEKKYKLTAPHSEVVEVLQHIDSGDALDLGSGRGRNSVFLQTHGFQVTALDNKEAALTKLRRIVDEESACVGLRAELYDIATASIQQAYDLIVSTVVLQFLPADSIPAVIGNMQAQTRVGGVNLVVAPMSTAEAPCPIDWPFTFGAGELARYYRDWTILKYNENPGTFHRVDESGHRVGATFATLVARR
ncbi:MAG: SAM-dependent methyltransferase TehB [Pseudomonadota bacterium]